MLELALAQAVAELVALFFNTTESFGHRQFGLHAAGLQLRFQIADFSVFLQGERLDLLGKTRLRHAGSGFTTFPHLLQFAGQEIPLLLGGAHGLLHRQFLLHIPSPQLRLQLL